MRYYVLNKTVLTGITKKKKKSNADFANWKMPKPDD